VATTTAFFEIANECENVVRAFGLDTELKGNRALIRKLRELMISTSEERLDVSGKAPIKLPNATYPPGMGKPNGRVRVFRPSNRRIDP
jgi:hypothetical protein